jgi:hypothetical protein
MPATPTIALVEDSINGCIIVQWTNSDTPAIIRIKRASPTETDGTYIILTELAEHNSEFLDFNAASLEPYSYIVEADDSGIAASAVATGSVTLGFPVIHAVTKRSGSSNMIPGTSVVLKTIPPHNRQVRFEHESLMLTGAIQEELLIDPIPNHQIDLPGLVTRSDDGQREALRKLFNSKATICVRDGLGHKWFASLIDYNEGYEFNTNIPLVLNEDDFMEAAA